MYDDAMFKGLVENSDDIIVVTDEDFRIRYASSAVKKNFGVTPLELLGANILRFVSSEKKHKWRARLENPHLEPFQEEISLSKSDHEKAYFDVEVSSLGNANGVMVRLHDITARKNKESELIRSNQQLDQVIYKTTHDLRAPLMSAMGLINLAELAPAQEKEKYLRLIRQSLVKLNLFIEEINDLLRNDKLGVQREKLTIETLLKDELANVQNLYEELNIDIGFAISAEADFYSDSIRVRTIVTNLLSNAIKYSDAKKSNPFIRIYVHITGEFCVIRFTDNGIGIKPEYTGKIFDLFFRGTSQSQGTGLGLFIVKDTIEKLKGSIEVSSIVDEGTTFTIRLPNQIGQPVGV